MNVPFSNDALARLLATAEHDAAERDSIVATFREELQKHGLPKRAQAFALRRVEAALDMAGPITTPLPSVPPEALPAIEAMNAAQKRFVTALAFQLVLTSIELWNATQGED